MEQFSAAKRRPQQASFFVTHHRAFLQCQFTMTNLPLTLREPIKV